MSRQAGILGDLLMEVWCLIKYVVIVCPRPLRPLTRGLEFR